MDIQLNTDHDIDFTNNVMSLTDDDNGESVKQRILIRLLSFKGEWFANTDYGVAYYQTIFQKNVSKDVVDTIIKKEITDVEGVGRIISYTSTLNFVTRDYTASFRVLTTSGVTLEITI